MRCDLGKIVCAILGLLFFIIACRGWHTDMLPFVEETYLEMSSSSFSERRSIFGEFSPPIQDRSPLSKMGRENKMNNGWFMSGKWKPFVFRTPLLSLTNQGFWWGISFCSSNLLFVAEMSKGRRGRQLREFGSWTTCFARPRSSTSPAFCHRRQGKIQPKHTPHSHGGNEKNMLSVAKTLVYRERDSKYSFHFYERNAFLTFTIHCKPVFRQGPK